MRIIFGEGAYCADTTNIHSTTHFVTFTTDKFSAAELWQMQQKKIICSFASCGTKFSISVDIEKIHSIG